MSERANLWLADQWLTGGDTIPSSFNQADIAFSGYLDASHAWPDPGASINPWMPLCEMDGGSFDLVAVTADVLFDELRPRTPRDIEDQIGGLVGFFAATFGGVRGIEHVAQTFSLCASTRRGMDRITQGFIFRLHDAVRTRRPAERIDELRELLFDGSPIRATDREGEGAAGTRLIPGLETPVAVAISITR